MLSAHPKPLNAAVSNASNLSAAFSSPHWQLAPLSPVSLHRVVLESFCVLCNSGIKYFFWSWRRLSYVCSIVLQYFSIKLVSVKSPSENSDEQGSAPRVWRREGRENWHPLLVKALNLP